MELNFRVNNGRFFSLSGVSGSMTVADLKQKISDAKADVVDGFPANRLHLIISYKQRPPHGLDMNKFENKTLDELNINDGETIHIVFILGRKEGSGRKSRRSNRRNNRKSRRSKSRR